MPAMKKKNVLASLTCREQAAKTPQLSLQEQLRDFPLAALEASIDV